MNFFNQKRVLIISPESWNHISVSKHHYAKTLASIGNKVFFLNPPSQRNASIVDGNITVIDHTTFRGLNRMPQVVRNFLSGILIRRLESEYGGKFDVVWTFDAFRFQNLQLFRAQLTIYHAVDIHIAPLEHELARSCDLILSVSELIRKRFDSYKKVNIKINHGLANHFTNAMTKWEYSPKPANEIVNVGYIGNLDNWCIDIPTLLSIIESNGAVNFYFVGPYKENSSLAESLKKLPNCYLKGRVPTEQLPAILQEMDLFLMCYKGEEKEVNSNHHKILEFLSTGKPSVINYTDEYDNHRDLVAMANSNEELLSLFKEVLSNFEQFNQPSLVESRMKFAQANSYHAHIQTIDKIAVQIIAEKV